MKTLQFYGAGLILVLSAAIFAQDPVSEGPAQIAELAIETTEQSAATLTGVEPVDLWQFDGLLIDRNRCHGTELVPG